MGRTRWFGPMVVVFLLCSLSTSAWAKGGLSRAPVAKFGISRLALFGALARVARFDLQANHFGRPLDRAERLAVYGGLRQAVRRATDREIGVLLDILKAPGERMPFEQLPAMVRTGDLHFCDVDGRNDAWLNVGSLVTGKSEVNQPLGRFRVEVHNDRPVVTLGQAISELNAALALHPSRR